MLLLLYFGPGTCCNPIEQGQYKLDATAVGNPKGPILGKFRIRTCFLDMQLQERPQLKSRTINLCFSCLRVW